MPSGCIRVKNATRYDCISTLTAILEYLISLKQWLEPNGTPLKGVYQGKTKTTGLGNNTLSDEACGIHKKP